ncbi:hypothetical protein [Bradyrhizobium sp. Ash2021]|uniref:hypothetical protein n=1 Tax=Bradyrhizobium sp. Ash2021 TaxID=2954771 RepID=UPI0028164C63|nr:hypothetical protein [Bradyrhizobium sp. Ash2021]WMT77458.1 hypothetical protein NL528_14360 [Bradyrhizobium sp. Ash2021]
MADVARRPTFEMAAEVSREDVRYFIGVDLGQSHDPTAIAVVRRVRFLVSHDVQRSTPIWKEEKPTIYQCGYLERVPLGTVYPAIVAHVGRLLERPIWSGKIDLALDQTGVGKPVCDMFTSAGLTFTGVMITGGDAETNEGKTWRVPKMTLVSSLQALLHEGRLHIQKELTEAAELVRELQDFRVKYTEAGHLTFSAREGKHDDLVLALAIAVWRARKHITKTESFYMNWIER